MHHETLKYPKSYLLSHKNRLDLQGRLLELAHDAIIVRDPQSAIVFWNQGAQQLYGWTAEEAMGQITHTLLQTRFPIPLADIQHILETKGYWEGDLIHIGRTGEQIIVESRHVLERDANAKPIAILEINRDVTERRRLEKIEQKLQAEQQAKLDFLQLIVDELPVSIYLVQGPDARFVLSNRAAANVWGVEMKPGQPLAEFMKENNIQLLGPGGQALSLQQLAVYRATTTGESIYQFQEVVRRPDGTTIPILVCAIPLKEHKDLRRISHHLASDSPLDEQIVLVVHQDVTTLKESEKLKDEFINLATHELRTPVTIVAMGADMLLTRAARGRGQPLDTRQEKIIQDMRQATRQLSKITEDLVDTTRMQAGHLKLERKSVDLILLARQVIGRLQLTTQLHQINLHTSLDTLCAFVDADRIEQVLTNLLSNAIKYSPQGGPVDVTIADKTGANEALIAVQDHGLGIPAHQQSRIFGRFMRADNAKAMHISGTGLGLYLCRELIENHGGHIWFDSTEEEGSTFFFTLPLCSPQSVSDPHHPGGR
ncbi:sensor histidine kinase [Dictyobacter aurantiacus]|uniref:histidine kinase n=1 Tax=Dictyobacter aurantiacus TaxID=1936993 RepID=A0A401ZL03_9CHLR|nr:ATP-binding protein [Dictyobacter aurantiacus]GCE07561.1 hypothetical protein KDAU_48900 [Dictyobacter aurantiacus]